MQGIYLITNNLNNKRYVNETVDNIYQDYKNIYSYSGFKKIVQGVTFKNVPVYSKREKIWK